MAGQVSHLLDDEQRFMETSHPPIPFDPQGLVALFFLSAASTMDLSHTGLSAADIKPGGATVHAGISGGGHRHVKTYRVCGPSDSRANVSAGYEEGVLPHTCPDFGIDSGSKGC